MKKAADLRANELHELESRLDVQGELLARATEILIRNRSRGEPAEIAAARIAYDQTADIVDELVQQVRTRRAALLGLPEPPACLGAPSAAGVAERGTDATA